MAYSAIFKPFLANVEPFEIPNIFIGGSTLEFLLYVVTNLLFR